MTSLSSYTVLLLALLHGIHAFYNCKEDGHFSDPNDCSKYYHCANGRALPGFCPTGLFWNQASDQCDWPQVTDCDFSIEKARKLQEANPVLVYLTFDDGPGDGTKEVLDALKEHGVKATFFINSQNNLIPSKKLPVERAARNANLLVRIVSEGHMLADHSADHMFHNSDGPKNAYMDIHKDMGYFGGRNLYPVFAILQKAGFNDEYLKFVNYTMSNYVRMPYSNNWRALSQKGSKKIRHSCPECTVPARSGRNGVEIANMLDSQGVQVFGWDMEWNMDWTTNRVKYDGDRMFLRLGSGQFTKDKGKVVLLSHDAAWRPDEATGSLKEADKLRRFLYNGVSAGYTFRTLYDFYED